MKTYAEKLKDPRWQRKRLEIMQRDGFECAMCGTAETSLHVHHRYYITGRHPWEYPDWSLRTLCEDCHKSNHKRPGSDDGPKWAGYDQFEDVFEFLGAGVDFSEEHIWDLSIMVAQLALHIKKPAHDAIKMIVPAIVDLIESTEPSEEGGENGR